MAVPIADGAIGVEHEPLRPVAGSLRLLGEHDPQNFLGRAIMLERQEQLDRPLADVARAPGGAGILLQAVRHGQMDHRVMDQPGQEMVQRGQLAAASLQPQLAGHAAPVARRGRQLGRRIDPLPVPASQHRRSGRIGERAGDGEGEAVGQTAPQGDVAARA